MKIFSAISAKLEEESQSALKRPFQMKLFNISGEKLEAVGGNPFKLEKDIQSLIENNVDELFELEFVQSELRINNFRFDTLCF